MSPDPPLPAAALEPGENPTRYAAGAPLPAAAGLRLSRYQERILEFVRSGTGHGVVRATAGAGKTSTLVEVAAQLDEGSRACFLAFGRDAAAELGRRLPNWITASTVHGLGRKTLESALRRRGKRLQKVDKGKYRRLLRSRLTALRHDLRLGEEESVGLEEYLSSLVDLARLHLWDGSDAAALGEIVYRHSIVPPEPELELLAVDALKILFEQGVHEALELGLCDFTDMLYLPVIQQLEPPRFEFVCVDEAQDYSAAALAFTRRLVDPTEGGRLLFVGDPRQSIYGFAGADSEAMDRIARDTGATVLPLSITYRCPRSHVALARLLAPEIEAGPQASEGRVFWISDRVLEHWAHEGDMIICRANAPLVKTCLRLVRAGLRAFVRGRDLERQLQTLRERALGSSDRDSHERLDEFANRELARVRKLARDANQAHALMDGQRDLIDCLRFLATDPVTGRALSPGELQERIEETFDARDGAAVLSTIHRAKGLEADRILILYPELMPAPYARNAQSLRGEAAVQFVALTRAKRDLVFVSDPLAVAPPVPRQGSPAGGPTSVEPQLAPDDRSGQGPGAWHEVLALARLLARGRG